MSHPNSPSDSPDPTNPAVVDLINHPPHYSSHPSGVEAIDVCRHQTYAPGCATKYVYRWQDKGGSASLRKAEWYLTDADRQGTSLFSDADSYLEALPALALLVAHEFDADRTRYWQCLAAMDLDGMRCALDDMINASENPAI